MSSTQTIRFSNAMDINANPVTFILAERSVGGKLISFSVTNGGSMIHEARQCDGPWEVWAIVEGLEPGRDGHVTPVCAVAQLPADVTIVTDYVAGKLNVINLASDTDSRAVRSGKGGKHSIFDQDDSWMPVSDKPLAASKDLSFTMQPQKYSQWCWAAATTSVAHFYASTSDVTQCQLAQWKFGGSSCNCCSSSLPAACNRPSSTRDALFHVNHLNAATDGGIDFDAVKAQINGGHPVALHVQWRGSGSRHAIAITGYTADDKITVQDPDGTTSLVAFSTFPASYKGGATWDATFTTINHQ